MSASAGADSGAGSSLFSSLRSFWSVILAILYTRLDLASLELEEIAAYSAQLVLIGLAALLAVAMTIFFLLFFLVVTFWEERVLVLGIISLFGILSSAALVLVTRRMILNRPKFLAQTIAELRRDVETLRSEFKKEKAKA